MSKKRRRIDASTKGRRYLEETTPTRVRFSEVDSMRIVWHGHYVTYFEDGRRAFGRKYDLDYPVFLGHDVAAPVVRIWIDFLAPARMNDVLDITTRLFESDGAQMEFGFEIKRSPNGELLAAGGSLQVFTTLDGTLILTPPDFMVERYRQWESQWVTTEE